MRKFESIDEIKKANEEIGHHFFDNAWFCVVADPVVYAGRYFITENRVKIGKIEVPSEFSIRFVNDDGSIGTLGMFGEYKTLKDAQEKARGLSD